MATDRWSLAKDPDELSRLVRILGASVNVAILRELARARRRGDGWMYLSEIAEAIATTNTIEAAPMSRIVRTTPSFPPTRWDARVARRELRPTALVSLAPSSRAASLGAAAAAARGSAARAGRATPARSR